MEGGELRARLPWLRGKEVKETARQNTHNKMQTKYNPTELQRPAAWCG